MHLVTAFCSISISVPLVLLLDPCHFGWLCLYCWWDVVSVHCINIRWSKSSVCALFTHTMVTFGHQNTPMLSLCKVSYTIWANTWLDMLPYVHPVIAGQLQHLLGQLCAIDECLLKRCMQCVVLILHSQGTWIDAYSLMGSKIGICVHSYDVSYELFILPTLLSGDQHSSGMRYFMYRTCHSPLALLSHIRT